MSSDITHNHITCTLPNIVQLRGAFLFPWDGILVNFFPVKHNFFHLPEFCFGSGHVYGGGAGMLAVKFSQNHLPTPYPKVIHCMVHLTSKYLPV